MDTALEKAEKIKSVFINTQLFSATNPKPEELSEYLETLETEFRSIGYESASMDIAIKDFEANSFPLQWILFANGKASAHLAQVYVGLGWAIAKLNIPFLAAAKKVNVQFHFRIADGCGYYDGSFRYRRTVVLGELPAYLPLEALPMYDQGIGRSIWYTEKADIHKIAAKIEGFAKSRHSDLWRGIGIAVAFVGGCSEEELKKLMHIAAGHGLQLAYGAALAAKSRLMANTMTSDTELCTRLWFNITTNLSNPLCTGDDNAYLNWIADIEKELADSFEKKT